MKKLTNDEFVQRSNLIHNFKYDYINATYVDAFAKVCIICPTHGEFFQIANTHLNGHGCSKCSVKIVREKNTHTKEIFIKAAKNVHNNKYKYSLVEYINSHLKVKIICPKHGEFKQKPNTHLGGSGCPKCGNERSNIKKKLTTKIFIERANKAHDTKYNYSKVDYVSAHVKVKIICSAHGEFQKTPDAHLNGGGCQICFYETRAARHPKRCNTGGFIKKAVKIHGNRYDYNYVNYINDSTKVKIGCLIHGIFEQTPNAHLQGHGCSKCNIIGGYSLKFFKRHPEYKNKQCTLYLLQFNFKNESFIKIGITTKTLRERFRDHGKDIFKVIFRLSMPLFEAFKFEQKVLREYYIHKYYPQNLKDGKSECFLLSMKDEVFQEKFLDALWLKVFSCDTCGYKTQRKNSG